MTAPRRRKGEGSISRFHNHPTCPPVGEDGARPDHKCQGPYRARVWVRTVTGQQVRKTVYGKTEREVLNKLKKLTVAEGTGKVVASSPTVGQWFDPEGEANYWSQNVRTWKASTARTYRSIITNWIMPELGSIRLDRLTPDHVAALYAMMFRKGRKGGRVAQVHVVLRKGLQAALRQGKVSTNVADLIPAPEKNAERRTGLTVEDAWKVLDLAGDNARWWVALMMGLRQGEVLGLRWEDVELDADAPYIHVRHTATRVPGVGMTLDTPKTKTSVRMVPLLPQVESRLRVARAKAFLNGATADDLVFPSSVGTIRDPKEDHVLWTRLLTDAGVPHVTLHSARNTAAQLLENAGVPDRVVAEILGHAAVSMTHHYQAGNLSAKKEAMRALGEYLEANRPA